LLASVKTTIRLSRTPPERRTCGSGDNALFRVDDINGSILKENNDDDINKFKLPISMKGRERLLITCECKYNIYGYTARLQEEGNCGARANALFYVDGINGSILKESEEEDYDEFRITGAEKFLMDCEREDKRYRYYARLQ
jgi:hypothetical protein